jgi:hypothetical protein
MVLINLLNLLFLTFYKKIFVLLLWKYFIISAGTVIKEFLKPLVPILTGFRKTLETLHKAICKKKLLTPMFFGDHFIYSRYQWLSETFYERASAFWILYTNKNGALTLRPPTNWPRNTLSHTKHPQNFLSTMTIYYCDTSNLWQCSTVT